MEVLLYRAVTSTGMNYVDGAVQATFREDYAYWDTNLRQVVWAYNVNVTSPESDFSLSSQTLVDSYCLFATATPPYTKVDIKHSGNGEVEEFYTNNSTECGFTPVFYGEATFTAVCKPGTVGNDSIGHGTATSNISQADADNLAKLEAIRNAESKLVCKTVDSLFRALPANMVEDKSFTMSYSAKAHYWIGEHTYKPSLYNQGAAFVSLDQNKVFKHNANNIAIFYDGKPSKSIIQMPIAIEPGSKKKFASLQWITESKVGEFIQLSKTFDEILLYNSRQCSGYIPLKGNLHNVKNTWTFNQYSDLVLRPSEPFIKNGEPILTNLDAKKPFYQHRKFIDNYLVIRFILHNLIDSNGQQSKISFYDLSAYMTKHIR